MDGSDPRVSALDPVKGHGTMISTPEGFFTNSQAAHDDDAIAHVFVRDQLLQMPEAPGWLPWSAYRASGLQAARTHVIGVHQGRTHVAVSLPETTEIASLQPFWRGGGLRAWFGVLRDEHLAIAMRAVQLLEWDRTHRFCGACGTPTELMPGERAMRCPNCALAVYPRISPAMMVLIKRGRELLLGRGINFPAGRYSALAGFLEAGESIEDAVHREVREEVSVEVNNLRYFGSQSWPFPNSLMIAFTADWVSGEVKADPAELADAQFFDIDDLPSMPPRLSIARALLDDTIRRIRAEGA